MKRVWAAIAMVILLLVLCITGLIFTHENISSLTNKIEETKNLVSQGEIEQAKQSNQELTQMWDDHYRVFCTYISHDKLEAIDQSMATLSTKLEYQEYSEFTTELDRACAQLRHLQDTELPTLENIL